MPKFPAKADEAYQVTTFHCHGGKVIYMYTVMGLDPTFAGIPDCFFVGFAMAQVPLQGHPPIAAEFLLAGAKTVKEAVEIYDKVVEQECTQAVENRMYQIKRQQLASAGRLPQPHKS